MAEIDNKIVSINFDNVSFQRKMSETIASLDKLRQSLDLAGAKQGLADVAAAGQNFNMGNMAGAVEGISAKFVALSTIAITALSKITSAAIDTAAGIIKSFSFGPVTEGFAEFELKMGSIQTIMAGSGADLETVNRKLAELNDYSDRTIYSFKDMTSNIGKFTNAGVGLDESVGAIQGVANVAALAGANSEEASRGMYNFAQALSTGSVKLIDWKSIELANMGTVEFKQQIIDTAVAMGTLKKSGDGTLKTLKGTDVTTKNFNSTLQDAWFTSDVLTSTLNKFSDETTDIGKRAAAAATDVKTFSQMIGTMKESIGSGWATTFERVFGDFEEGKALWSGIMGSFDSFVGKSSDSRNEMLRHWKNFGARDALIQGFKNAFQGIASILKPIGEAFREIFPKKRAEDLIIWTARFRDFTEKIKIGEDTAKKIKTAFKAFFAVLDIGWEIFKGVTKVFFALVKGAWSLLGPILGLAAGSTSVVSSFHEMLIGGGGLTKFFDIVTGAIDGAVVAIKAFAGGVITFFAKFGPVVSDALDAVKNFAGEVVDFFSGLGPIIMMPYNALKRVTGAIVDFFQSLSFGGKKDDNAVEKTSKDLENSVSLADRLLSSLKNVFGQIGEFLGGIVDAIAGAFKGLGGAIGEALGSGNFNNVLNILKAGALGGILFYIRKFFKEGLKFDFGQGAIMDKIGNVLDTLTGGLKSLQANVRADTLLKIAGAMGILAIAIVALSLVDAEALAKAMAAIAVGFGQLTAVMVILEKSSRGGGAIKIAAMAAGMVLLAGAMALLVIPIMILGKMDMDELAKGLGAVTIGMLVMAAAMKIIGSSSSLTGIVRAGLAMILIAGAMIVMAKAIKAFAEMNLTEMAYGLAQAALGIGLLIMALRRMPDDVAKKGLGLLILAFSLRSLAKVVQLFAGISLGVLAKGFISIAIGLQLIGMAMRAFPEDMVKKAAGLVIMSAALYLVGKVIEQIGNLPFAVLLKGILALNFMLGMLVVTMNAMAGAQSGALGMILAAGALMILGKAVEQVGKIPLGELIKGVAGLAAVLAVLAIASLVAPGLLILGVALMAIGAGFAFIGVGVMLAGKGFELLAKFGGAGMKHLAAALQEMIKQLPRFVSAFVEGIMMAATEIGARIPELVEVIGGIIVSLLDLVERLAPEFAATLVAMVVSGLAALRAMIPDVVQTGMEVLLGLLTGLRDNMYQMTNLGIDILTAFLAGIATRMEDIVSAALGVVLAFVQAVADKAEDIVEAGLNLVVQIVFGITKSIGLIVDAVGSLITGFLDAIGDNVYQIVAAGAGILGKFLEGISDAIPYIAHQIYKVITEITQAISTYTPLVVDAFFQMFIDLFNGLADVIEDQSDELGQAMGHLAAALVIGIGDALREAIKTIANELFPGLGTVVSGILDFFGIASPSKVFYWIGEQLMVGFADGVFKNMDQPKSALAAGANGMVNTMSDTMASLARSLEQDMEFNPTITPVLDLTKIKEEAKNIGGAMGDPSLAPIVSLRDAKYISGATMTRPDATQDVAQGASEVKFEQNIYAPTELSTNDIYRNTKSQFVMAKEELKI